MLEGHENGMKLNNLVADAIKGTTLQVEDSSPGISNKIRCWQNLTKKQLQNARGLIENNLYKLFMDGQISYGSYLEKNQGSVLYGQDVYKGKASSIVGRA